MNLLSINIDQRGVASVVLNRPELRNALNPQLISEISEAFKSLEKDKNVRLITLSGAGKAFCAGADLNYMKQIADFGFDQNKQDAMQLAMCFYDIYNCRIPTMAIVKGAAIGGANGLLAACDFVYCTADTKFAFSEVKLGITPATISPYIIKRIGEFGARDLMISGRLFNGREAERAGLVNKALKPEELDEFVDQQISILLSSGPQAVIACKKLVSDISNHLSYEESIPFTAERIAEIRASAEAQEGMASFLEKRKPGWIKS